MSKLGVHLNQGSRDGYGLVAAARPSVVLAVNEGGALTEVSAPTVRIFRDTTVFGDAPPGIDETSEANARAMADLFYPALRQKWLANPADYYQPTNEYGGNNPAALAKLVAFESRLLELAAADGLKLCVGSFAGGSPGDFELWKQLCLPLVLKAWQGGSIYGRHAYGPGLLTNGDGTPTDGNSGRPFVEAAHLQSLGVSGGMVITEAGPNAGFGFPGVHEFMVDAERFDSLMQQYPHIIGCCLWTYGEYQGFPANIQAASQRLAEYLTLRPVQPWQPPAAEPVIVVTAEPATKVTTTAMTTLHSAPRPGADSRLVPIGASRDFEKLAEVEGEPVDGDANWIQVACYLHRTFVAKEMRSRALPRVKTTGMVFLRSAPRIVEATRLGTLQVGRVLEKVGEVEGNAFGGVNEWVKVACYLPARAVAAALPPSLFSFTHWPTTVKIITQGFGEDPDYYHGLNPQLLGHDGLDIAAPLGSSVFAVAAGTVSDIHRLDTGDHCYGIFVRIRHVAGYETTYGHLKEVREGLNVGDVVSGGQLIGLADNTGCIKSGDSHLHVTLKHDDAIPGGTTYIGYGFRIVNPTPFIAPLLGAVGVTAPLAATPTANRVDLAAYIQGGVQANGPLYEVQMKDAGQARHQTQISNGRCFHTKGENQAEWEELWANDHFIMRGTDTSPGSGEYYTLSDAGAVGSKWAARYMAVGETFERNPTVVHFRKGDCQEVRRGTVRSWIKLVAVHPALRFFTGIELPEVIELAWLESPAGPVLETYFYARNFGLVGWKSHDGRQSAISEIHAPGSRPDNVREVIGCL